MTENSEAQRAAQAAAIRKVSETLARFAEESAATVGKITNAMTLANEAIKQLTSGGVANTKAIQEITGRILALETQMAQALNGLNNMKIVWDEILEERGGYIAKRLELQKRVEMLEALILMPESEEEDN